MHYSKKFLSFALLIFASFFNIQSVALEGIFAMQPVELEEYLKERSTKEIKELKRILALERIHELKQNAKYKVKFENGTYRFHLAVAAGGLSVIAMFSSFIYMAKDIEPLLPKDYTSMPPESREELIEKVFPEVLWNYTSGLAFLVSCIAATIPPIYSFINRHFAERVQRKRIGSFERLFVIVKLEEVVNQALAERG